MTFLCQACIKAYGTLRSDCTDTENVRVKGAGRAVEWLVFKIRNVFLKTDCLENADKEN
jgi:hypothetical protein